MKNKRLWVSGAILINIVFWLIPSNVVELIAERQDVLLGRYSVERLALLLFLLPVTAIFIYIITAQNKRTFKLRIFKITAMIFASVFCLGIIDIILRSQKRVGYVYESEGLFHRIPDDYKEGVYKDIPEVVKSYPNAVVKGSPNALQGYPDVKYQFTVDQRGFRNPKEDKDYQAIALGDSFVEGSQVTDSDAWPRQFSEMSGIETYCLGISGSDSQDYLAILRKYGPEFKNCKIVMCMIYEGNDFKGNGTLENRLKNAKKRSLNKHFVKFYKASPILAFVKRSLIISFQSINKNASFANAEMIAWLPFRVPDNAGWYCSFPPKRLAELTSSEETFAKSKGWKSVALALLEMQKFCQQNNLKFLLVYAPTKAHVVLPLVKDDLPFDKMLEFAHIDSKKTLAKSGEEFREKLLKNLSSKEAVAAKFCAENSIAFLSLTEYLRSEAKKGNQVYYTYDQHWTPIGQKIAATAIAEYWQKNK